MFGFLKLTKSHILLIKYYFLLHIYCATARLFYKYKQNYNSSEAAFDEIFNLGNRLYQNSNQSNNNLKVLENRTNLNTHIKSWTNSNVINTYKGKVISYEKLVHETEEVLIEIIYHLKQYGMNLDVNSMILNILYLTI